MKKKKALNAPCAPRRRGRPRKAAIAHPVAAIHVERGTERDLRIAAIRAAHLARRSRSRDYGDVFDAETPDLNFDILDEQ